MISNTVGTQLGSVTVSDPRRSIPDLEDHYVALDAGWRNHR